MSSWQCNNEKVRRKLRNRGIDQWDTLQAGVWRRRAGKDADLQCSCFYYNLKETVNEENGAAGIISHKFLYKGQNPFLVVEIRTLDSRILGFKSRLHNYKLSVHGQFSQSPHASVSLFGKKKSQQHTFRRCLGGSSENDTQKALRKIPTLK